MRIAIDTRAKTDFDVMFSNLCEREFRLENRNLRSNRTIFFIFSFFFSVDSQCRCADTRRGSAMDPKPSIICTTNRIRLERPTDEHSKDRRLLIRPRARRSHRSPFTPGVAFTNTFVLNVRRARGNVLNGVDWLINNSRSVGR